MPAAAHRPALLAIDNLSVEFRSMAGTVKAVNGLSLAVPPGRTVAVVGESGSGKSVTSQAILGLLPKSGVITSGSILFRDDTMGEVDLATLPRVSPQFRAIRGRSIAMVFQEPMTAFSPLHTLGDQIGEGIAIHERVGRAEIAERVKETLRLVQFPEPDRAVKMYPFELSGGLRQRAMIAMALICRPSLLIADEPTTALDVTLQAQVLKLLRDLQRELKMAVLLITHDLGVVANLAEDVVVMHHGKVVESGPTEAIFNRPRHPYLISLMKAVPDFELGEQRRLTPIREIKVDPDALMGRKSSGTPGETLLSVSNLNKSFSLRGDRRIFGRSPLLKIHALRDVSLTIRRGESVGLVGESGSGKTTLARAIMRAVAVDSGEIVIDGPGGPVDLVAADRQTLFAIRKRMQYVFQDPFSSLDPRMTVGAILAEPFDVHGLCDPRDTGAKIERLLKAVGLEPSYASRYPHSFSGGQRQRIGIARALALEPEILICDEPVAALDVSVQAQILNLLKDLQKLAGLTYLFISHNLAVVNHFADRIVVMCDGAIVEVAPREELFRKPLHPYTRLLMRAVPHADPARPLDFDNLPAAGKFGRRNWPAPFTVSTDAPLPPLLEVRPRHFVRAASLDFLAHAADAADGQGSAG
ncbi:ABC transporter ATP-binding protein [Aurantimonas sp. VKM B-3413]|uniref:ABC transporter ATP-binding protein n=1 Tax=Aurantimonas sp. VKM B-3413 TaxID=2779401 RepID=UPI001E3BDB8F|nr:ABC transporter ATP-binding protein [Aurantimonas sp. VKM B-3413]MCB8836729.1 ABC transporter ATP-binding protein [Aurantimonas sp. VKM B-3413]